MSDFVQRIYDFNRDNGLLEKKYSDYLESSYQIEEALEGFDLELLASQLFPIERAEDTCNAKYLSRHIVTLAAGQKMSLADVDRLDKACDAIVFAVGSMAKLGLKPAQIHEALNIVMDANQAKTGCPKDSEGKLLKPDNFPNPEPRLQALLEVRQ